MEEQRDQLQNEVAEEQQNRVDLAKDVDKIKKEAEELRAKDW